MLAHNNEIFKPIKEQSLKRISKLKEIIGKTFSNPDHNKNLMKGSRWNEDDRIFYIFCGDVIEKVSKERNVQKVSEEEAFKELLAMDQQEIDLLLIAAMKDAAHSDYWYRYEKDWG